MNDNTPSLFQHWWNWGKSLSADETVISVPVNILGRSVRK